MEPVNSIDDIVDSYTPKKTSLWEYTKVFAAVEAGSYAGTAAGVYLSAALTKSNILITGGLFSGEFIGGTIGQLASYWYNNKEKFKDKETGKIKRRELMKDFTKLLVYDSPITLLSYAATAKLTYEMLEHDWDKIWVVSASYISMTLIWHALNYFVYSFVKNGSDERLIRKISSGLEKHKNSFTDKNSC